MDNIENIRLEHMKRFQVGQQRVAAKLDELVHRIGHIEIGVASVRRDVGQAESVSAEVSVRLDKLNERLDRVERRLELQ